MWPLSAHSFPPSSLDYRCTELIVSTKKVVGCRGGSRNVEGCWGVHHLKIEKLPNVHLMLFDRYEIHIQYFEHVLRGSSSFAGARLRLYNFSKFETSTCQISNCQTFKSPILKFPHFRICKGQHFSFSNLQVTIFTFPKFHFSNFQIFKASNFGK